MRLTEQEYAALTGANKHTSRKTKYNNKRTKVDGISFDSKLEAQFYEHLKLLMRAGEIAGFCRQPQFVLMEGNDNDTAITYKADFIVFNNDGTYRIVDVKGYESDQWKRTAKQFRLKFPKLELIVKKLSGKKRNF